MVGALSFIAAGAAQGLGRGIADYGSDLMRQAVEGEAEQRRAAMMATERARAASTAASPAQRLSEFGDMLLQGRLRGALAAGGMAGDRAADFEALAAGQAPAQQVSLESPDRRPDRMDDLQASGQSAAAVPKYSDGQAEQLMVDGFRALRRAMGIVQPEAADNIAQAERTEYATGALRRYEAGSTQAGRAALAEAGKTTFGPTGDELTGAVPPGSVAASQIRENDAQAMASRATAGARDADRRKTLAEIDGDLAKGVSRERLATMLNSLNTYAKDMDLSDEEKRKINELRQQITAAMRGEVQSRGPGAPGGRPAAGGKADAGGQASAPPVSLLKEGTRTKFANGQVWTLRNGKPVQVQ